MSSEIVYDLVIAGLGSHGSSCFRHFAGKMNVLAIEQYDSPHTMGSHSGGARIIRQMQYKDLDYIQLAQRSIELWKETNLFTQCGVICFGRQSQDEIDPTAGYVIADQVIESFIRESKAKGGLILKSKYIRHRQESDYVLIFTDTLIIKARKLILSLGIALKQQIYFFKTDHQEFKTMPVFLSQLDSTYIYGFPAINGEVKVGVDHRGSSLVYPQAENSIDVTQSLQMIRRFFAQYFPKLVDAPLSRVESCIYTTTLDENFVIDFDPQSKDTIILSACSGHGFKFCIAMGELIEQMLLKNYQSDLFKLKSNL